MVAWLAEPLRRLDIWRTKRDGTTVITGRLVLQVTNLSTGKSVVVNASGPAFLSADGAQLTLRGNSLIVGQADDFYPRAAPLRKPGTAPISAPSSKSWPGKPTVYAPHQKLAAITT